MLLSLLTNNLKEAVRIIEKSLGKNITLPILENIFLKTENNFLVLKTTNLEIGITTWVLSKNEKTGEVCISAEIFKNLIDNIKEEIITLEQEKTNLIIKGKNFQAKIKSQETKDFPIIPYPKGTEELLEIKAPLFCQALLQVVQIPSYSSVRPELSGVFLSFQKDKIEIVGTDSFRLARKIIFQETRLLNDYNFILPQKTAREIVNIFSKEEKIVFHLSVENIFLESFFQEIKHPKIILTSRLIEGEFPDYKEIIPQKFQTTLFLKTDDFISQIKSANIFSGRENEISFFIKTKEKKIEITTNNDKLGEYKSFLDCQIEGKDLKITFNSKFLMDGILNINQPNLIFQLTSEEGPAILKGEKDDQYLYILMPVKTF
ncbi:MAG: DNA polymerase III subunit beta [Minisyncoccales bacterium]